MWIRIRILLLIKVMRIYDQGLRILQAYFERPRHGVLETNKNNFRFEPKQTETRSVSRLFRFVSWNQKKCFSVCFGVSNLYRNNRNKQNCFETNRNNPEFFSAKNKTKRSHAFELSTMQGTETIPNLFSKKTKSSPWTQWLNTLIFGLCTVISTTIFPSLLNNYGYPTETIKYNPSQRVFLKVY